MWNSVAQAAPPPLLPQGRILLAQCPQCQSFLFSARLSHNRNPLVWPGPPRVTWASWTHEKPNHFYWGPGDSYPCGPSRGSASKRACSWDLCQSSSHRSRAQAYGLLATWPLQVLVALTSHFSHMQGGYKCPRNMAVGSRKRICAVK